MQRTELGRHDQVVGFGVDAQVVEGVEGENVVVVGKLARGGGDPQVGFLEPSLFGGRCEVKGGWLEDGAWV